MRIRDIVSEDNREEAKKIIQQINDLNDIPGLSGIEFDDDGEVADATSKAKNIEPAEPKQLTPLQQQRQVGQRAGNIGQWALHTTDHEAFVSMAKADFLMASAHYESNDFDPRFKKYENFISLGRGKNNIFQSSMYEGGVTMVLDVNKMRQIRGAKYSKAFVYGSYDEKTKKLEPAKRSSQTPSGKSFIDEAEHRMYFKTQFIDDWHKYIKEIHFNMPVREGKPASHLIKAEELARDYAEKFNIKYFVYKDRAAYNMLAKGYAMSSRAIKKAGGLARLLALLFSRGRVKLR